MVLTPLQEQSRKPFSFFRASPDQKMPEMGRYWALQYMGFLVTRKDEALVRDHTGSKSQTKVLGQLAADPPASLC